MAAVTTLALAAPAAAQQTVSVTERVFYGDLDLSTPKGARAMFHRMQGAASRACAQPHSPALQRGEAELARCRTTTLHSAVAELGAPLVTARYARNYGDRQTLAAAR
jgi:UrcA family protein